jgi:hypothetical protein
MVKVRTKIRSPGISGVLCKNPKCGAEIPMSGTVDNLQKTFEALCQTCNQTATYRKSELKNLLGGARQLSLASKS